MCTCASCEYTDGFADKGFAEWPRGEPAGERSSERTYAAHWRHCNAMADYRPLERTFPQRFPQHPGLVPPVKPNAEAIRWNTGRGKASPVLPEPARPADPGKDLPHFPAVDRNTAERVQYSANDSEEGSMAKFMTVAQASEAWNISPMRIRQWISEGRVKAQKIGRDWLIPERARRPEPMAPGVKRQSSG